MQIGASSINNGVGRGFVPIGGFRNVRHRAVCGRLRQGRQDAYPNSEGLGDSRPGRHSEAPDEFGFYSNVNPKRPHPRWSQATEKLIPNMEVVPTQLYNGYGKWGADMYNGKEF